MICIRSQESFRASGVGTDDYFIPGAANSTYTLLHNKVFGKSWTKREKISAHSLRHTAAQVLLKKGGGAHSCTATTAAPGVIFHTDLYQTAVPAGLLL